MIKDAVSKAILETNVTELNNYRNTKLLKKELEKLNGEIKTIKEQINNLNGVIKGISE
jgi:peptidoglycan hydrolase CwlO-like protein